MSYLPRSICIIWHTLSSPNQTWRQASHGSQLLPRGPSMYCMPLIVWINSTRETIDGQKENIWQCRHWSSLIFFSSMNPLQQEWQIRKYVLTNQSIVSFICICLISGISAIFFPKFSNDLHTLHKRQSICLQIWKNKTKNNKQIKYLKIKNLDRPDFLTNLSTTPLFENCKNINIFYILFIPLI